MTRGKKQVFLSILPDGSVPRAPIQSAPARVRGSGGGLARPGYCPAPVNVLAATFAQSRPAISKHLRILNAAHVVSEQRAGRERIYRIEPDTLRQIDDWIGGYRSLWQDNLNRLKTYLEKT